MTAHGSAHHRRAARVLARRSPTKPQVLKERFSPTAIYPGMTETDIPSITDLFPGLEPPGQGHHKTPEITISTPPALPSLVPDIDIPTTTPSAIATPTTSDLIPILFTSSTLSTHLTTSTPTKVPTTSALLPTTSVIVPTTVTLETSASLVSSALPSASTTSAADNSGVSTGAVVGGVGAGIIAVAVIGFAVAFFIRRVRKREIDDAAGFDARDFRRSAVLLADPPTHEDTINRGYNPQHPGMTERPQAPIPESIGSYAEPYYGMNVAGQGSWNQSRNQYPAYCPSQNLNSNLTSPAVPPAHTLATAPVVHHIQNPFVPKTPPSPYEHASGLTREPSNHSTEGQALFNPPQAAGYPYPALMQNPSMKSVRIPADDYVDLNRSSVSPFQAVQYAEISRRLNDSSGALLPTSTSPAQLYATQQKDLPPAPGEFTRGVSAPPGHSAAPFSEPETPTADLAHSTPSNTKMELIPPAPISASQPDSPPESIIPPAPTPSPPPSTVNVQTLHLPAFSTDSLPQEEFEFPVPPSPAISYTSRYRVDSLPPSLPEISVQDRSSVSSYIPRSPMIGSGYISGMTDTSGVSGMSVVNSAGLQPIGSRSEGKFVPAPSPLASSFTASPFEQRQGEFAAAQSARKATAETRTQLAEYKNADSKRPNTVYNPDDAYGGF